MEGGYAKVHCDTAAIYCDWQLRMFNTEYSVLNLLTKVYDELLQFILVLTFCIIMLDFPSSDFIVLVCRFGRLFWLLEHLCCLLWKMLKPGSNSPLFAEKVGALAKQNLL